MALPAKRLGLSLNGVRFIGEFEGFRATPYNDAADNATIGYGHLIHYGPVTGADIAAWRTLGVAAGRELLRRDSERAVRALHDFVYVPIEQWQADALISAVYNCGPGILVGSVGRAVNARPHLPLSHLLDHTRAPAWYREVADALLLWDHAGGRVLAGLERRRLAEARLFQIGRYSVRGGNPYSNWE